jgi:hypothetical protein
MVRSMLVALIALACGYRGAVVGWEHDYLGTPFAPEDWWKIDDEARAVAQQKWLAADDDDEDRAAPDAHA